MTDEELLRAAATAAGIELQRSRLDDPLWRDMLLRVRDLKHNGRGVGWNPLTDDGDALRLAVKLNLTIDVDARCNTPRVKVFVTGEYPHVAAEMLGADPMLATRRAIVRAAAALA